MTEEELRKKLNPEQYRVMRQKDTERPFSGKYWDKEDTGVYACAACGTVLFTSLAQFDSKTGWPSFTDTPDKKNLDLQEDTSGTEVICKKCQSHLGYRVNTDAKRSYYRINSAALDFQPIEIEITEEETEKDTRGDAPTLPSVSASALALTPQSLLVLLVAALIGAVLGGGYGLSMCEVPTEETPTLAEPVSETSATFVAPTLTSPASSVSVPAGTPAEPAASSTESIPAEETDTATSSSADGTI